MTQYWKNPWSIADTLSLARYVARTSPIGVPADISTAQPLLTRVDKVYEALAELKYDYALEPWLGQRRIQLIRHPAQMAAEKVGTCVDLSLLFCAVCREARLVPWLVALDGHVLAMVSVVYDLESAGKDLQGRSGDVKLFADNVLKDVAPLITAIDHQRFVAVECTGFTNTTINADGSNTASRMSFKEAADAGAKIISAAKDKAANTPLSFRGAIDLHLAIEGNQLPPDGPVGEEPWHWRARRSNDALRQNLKINPLSQWTRTEEFPIPLDINFCSASSSQLIHLDDGLTLFDWMVKQRVRYVIIAGSGASGKSSYLQKLIAYAQSDALFVLLNLKLFSSSELSQPGAMKAGSPEDRIAALRVLQHCNILQGDSIRDLASRGPVALLVDGLNEVPDDQDRTSLLTLLKLLVYDRPNATIVVTTREAPMRWIQQWSTSAPAIHDALIATVEPLPPTGDYAAKITGASAGAGQVTSPFFLDRGMAPFNYLRDKLRLSESHIAQLSRVAYALYAERKLSFTKADFLQLVDPGDPLGLWEFCTSNHFIIPIGDSHAFEHQIFHDYLAGRHMATAGHDVARWTSTTFDAMTLDKASSDALTFALRELPDAKSGDAFLERVNDWNWRHAFNCLSIAVAESSINERKWSDEVEQAFSALLHDKREDPVWKTRIDAEHLWQRVSSKLPVRGRRTTGDAPKWSERWKAIYERHPENGELSFDLVASIVDSNSIVGWATANVLRRFHPKSASPLPEPTMALLRGMYLARQGEEDGAVRWRVVHALGAFPTPENTKLLLAALADANEYRWVRYGSARSLIEQAVRLGPTRERQSLLERIKENCASSATRPETAVLFELADTSLYRSADDKWVPSVLPMLHEIGRQFDGNEEKSSRWNELLRVLEHEQARWNPSSTAPAEATS